MEVASFQKLVVLMAAAYQAWDKAEANPTPANDRRACRAQQAVQDHCSLFGLHWDPVEFVMHGAVDHLEARTDRLPS